MVINYANVHLSFVNLSFSVEKISTRELILGSRYRVPDTGYRVQGAGNYELLVINCLACLWRVEISMKSEEFRFKIADCRLQKEIEEGEGDGDWDR